MRLIFLLSMIFFSCFTLASEDLSREEKDFSDRIRKSCDLPIVVNFHDFIYGRDEKSLYSNLHFEQASNLINEIEKACQVNPQNRTNLQRVKVIFVKRGSLGERKLIQKKNGDLVYLANRIQSEQQKNISDLVHDDLIRVLKLNYNAPPKPADVQKAKEEVKEKTQTAANDARAVKKQDEKNKKIALLTEWFQSEIKNITSKPGPEMAPKLDALQKSYQEKINALTTP
jgi:hypothetical protein